MIEQGDISKIETATSYMERLPEGIVVVRKKKDSFVDLKEAKEDAEAHRKLAGTKPSPSLLVMSQMMNASAEAREFFSDKIHEEYRCAEAFVIDNLALRILVTFYMKTAKKSYPISIFSNEEKALEWLRTFL